MPSWSCSKLWYTHFACFHVTGDLRQIVGQPVFVPLYKLFLTYGKIFRLSFGPKTFVVISDAAMAKQVPLCNAALLRQYIAGSEDSTLPLASRVSQVSGPWDDERDGFRFCSCS